MTARRGDEVLSAWIVVGRDPLDPWGRPIDEARHEELVARWQNLDERIRTLIAGVGYAVAEGVYLLPEGCYNFGATCAALVRSSGTGSQAVPQHVDAADATDRNAAHD